MLEALKQIRDNLINGWRNSTPAERVPYIAVVAGFLILVVAYVVWVSQPTWVFLTQTPNPGFSKRVTDVLDDKGIEYRIDQRGIYVHTDREKYVAQGEIAGKGIMPGGGGLTFDMFREPKLGTTGKVLQIQERAAIRSHIERILSAMEPVEWAMVQIDVPEETLFKDDSRAAVASVTLSTRGSLDPKQVKAIQNIVASADSRLTPESVRVIDKDLNPLSQEALDPIEGVTAAQLKIKRDYERMFEEKAVAVLRPLVGEGRAIVKVDLELDHQDREIESTTIDPDQVVVVQKETVSEVLNDSNTGSAPGVSANLPNEGVNASSSGGQGSTKDTTSTTSRVGETTTRERVQGPKITRMSVSVVVDEKYAGAGDAGTVPKGAEPEGLARVREIVEKAVGYQEERDGKGAVTVAFAPFPTVEPVSAGFNIQVWDALRNWRAAVGPILLLLVPLVCYAAYRKIEAKREAIRQDFHKRLEDLVKPLEEGKQDEDINFGLDELKLPEEERRTFKMQEKLMEYAKRNPKDFAQILKAWIRE